jgi:hypothetical protein
MNQTSPDFGLQLHNFTLLTNHTHVLVMIAQRPDVRMREIAATVGITERAVQRIVDDLTSSGYVLVTKDGRRNRYEIQPESPLRHHLDKHRNIGDLIRLIVPLYEGGLIQSRTGDLTNEQPPPGSIRASTTISYSSTLARSSSHPATDGSVFSAQACSDLLEALNGSPAVMAHGAELRSGEE